MLTTTAQGRTWNFSHAIGRIASAGEGFFGPTAVAIGPDSIVYVLNRGHAGGDIGVTSENQRISKLTMDEEFVGEFGWREFVWPVDLAVDSDGNLYCTDEHHCSVAIYDTEGKRIGSWGEAGSAPGQLDGPTGMEFGPDGSLYIADTGSNRIQRFSRDGEYLGGWGGPGAAPGSFSRPWGLTVDPEGCVYVADWGNDRVQKFSAEGEHLLTLGRENTRMQGLVRPSDVAVDSAGDIYVCDWGNHRVRVYDPGGSPVVSLHGDAQEFSKWGRTVVESNPDAVKAFRRVEDMTLLYRLNRPTGIAIDSEDRIVISDTNRGRLQVYVREKDYAEAQFNL